jgi:DNA-binding NtrC family response regulator
MSDKVRILVVDDEDVVRRSYVRTLASERCVVETAIDGEQALQKLGQQGFDVVLLDLRMPGIGGMTVLKAIKARWPDCEVVVITGYPMLETAKESVTLGAHDYLAKPVGPDEVINATNKALLHKGWALRREALPSCHCMH